MDRMHTKLISRMCIWLSKYLMLTIELMVRLNYTIIPSITLYKNSSFWVSPKPFSEIALCYNKGCIYWSVITIAQVTDINKKVPTAMLTLPRISSGILLASFRTWSKDPPSYRPMERLTNRGFSFTRKNTHKRHGLGQPTRVKKWIKFF